MNLMIEDLLSIEHQQEYHLDEIKRKKFSGVSTDSRTVKRGDVFIALRGDRFDGHKFIAQVFDRGAACAVVEKNAMGGKISGYPVLTVNDTTIALGALANVYRKKFDIPIIAVAGSNGKTTTKEMITAVLGTTYKVLSTQGNLNNHIGVPHTLFQLKEKHDVAVVEVGTNHFGELSYLCNILEPTAGLITNVGREHLEFFRTLAGVARAEGELFDSLAKAGIGYVNNDDKRIVARARKLKRKILYGFKKDNVHVAGKYIRQDNRGCVTFFVQPRDRREFPVHLSVPGKHAMYNALAAAAVGFSLEVQPSNIARALGAFSPVHKRMEVHEVGGITILNDTYNANPDSVLAALETLKAMSTKGKKIVILADMLEMGTAVDHEHARIGDAIKKMGFNYVLTFGRKAENIYRRAGVKFRKHYRDKKTLSRETARLLSRGDIVLVKGSRGMKMEEVVASLIQQFGGAA